MLSISIHRLNFYKLNGIRVPSTKSLVGSIYSSGFDFTEMSVHESPLDRIPVPSSPGEKRNDLEIYIMNFSFLDC